jgi:hypothetical protein
VRWPPAEKAHHPDAIRRDLELRGMSADEPHRPPRVDQRRRIQVAAAQAVLEDEGGHAARREPVGDLAAFEVGGQAAVGAAGGDHDRRAVAVARLHPEYCQRGDVGVFGALRSRRVAFPQAVGGRAEEGVRGARHGRRRRRRLGGHRAGAQERQA